MLTRGETDKGINAQKDKWKRRQRTHRTKGKKDVGKKSERQRKPVNIQVAQPRIGPFVESGVRALIVDR